jgi:hypothetical protein
LIALLAACAAVASSQTATAEGVIAEDDESASPNPVGGYLTFMLGLGGRYDDLRMCVASPAGAKGGPVAEFAGLGLRLRPSAALSVDANIPLGRALLFAIAFQMLQWEPDIAVNFHLGIDERSEVIIGPALGAAFHFGPDYRSDLDTKPRRDFFAIAPKVSVLLGYGKWLSSGTTERIIGVRPFFEYFFGQNDRRGVTIGAMLEFQWARKLL